MSDNEAKPDGDSKPVDGAEPITIRVRDQVRIELSWSATSATWRRREGVARAGLGRCQQVGDDVLCELGDVATCEVSRNIFFTAIIGVGRN